MRPCGLQVALGLSRWTSSPHPSLREIVSPQVLMGAPLDTLDPSRWPLLPPLPQVLMGAPLDTLDHSRWTCARAVVSGRFVNAFSHRDLTLSVVYR